ncbi:aryl-alcohol dehydrogenase-like predicted oxidoreductase [Streptomyces sp. V4I8]|uniref:aldo/keto reductase n=1 Tax=Streptomyces sp. V4I8 TaxID=3156469 RepID=UPI003518ACCA
MSAVLGLGTYRVRDVTKAAHLACGAGAAWIDTAPNYQNGRAHRELPPVIADHPGVRVSTKAGFISGHQRQAAVATGVLPPQAAASGHSLAPRFLRWQTARSLVHLRRVDLVFVHNPERVGDDRDAVHTALREAFTVLEDFARGGRIGGYGVATWSGFDIGAFTVPELLALAREAAGGPDHHLRAVQLPVSLVAVRPITLALDGRGPLVQARAAGLTTFGSSPLHGGELPGLVTPELVDFIRPGASPAGACLLAAASCPSLDVVLTSVSTEAHWLEAQGALALPLDAHRLREVADVLAAA